MKKLFIFIIALAGFGVSSYAQSTANAPTSATIVAPIVLTKTADMNFGNVAVSATTAGTVTLTNADARTAALGVTLPTTGGTVTSAAFSVSGEGTYTFAITLPSSLTISYLTNNMTVDTFTGPSTGTLSAGGAATFKVGATLHVSAGQAVGSYTNATGFPVTVNYN